MEKLKVFINGEFVESKTDVWYDLHNPSTGEITGQAPCCTTDGCQGSRLKHHGITGCHSRDGAALLRSRERRSCTRSAN